MSGSSESQNDIVDARGHLGLHYEVRATNTERSPGHGN